MHNGNFIPLDTTLEKLFRDNDYTQEVQPFEVYEWAYEVLDYIGAPETYKPGFHDIIISKSRGELPCNMKQIEATLWKNKNLPMRYSGDLMHNNYHCDNSADTSSGSDVTYTVTNGYIFTSFEEGIVTMATQDYYADEEGAPLIPDDYKVIRAVADFVRYKIDYKLWRKNKIKREVFMYSEREYLHSIGAAKTRLAIGTYDQMRSISNNALRLIPKINSWETFFKNTGSSEKRNNFSQ
jgi:hypothetical protein